MHLLLNSTRSMGEVRALFSWCGIHGFRIERLGGGPRPITPEMLCMDDPSDVVGAVEWGGFRTRIEAGPDLTGSITVLCGPDLVPPSMPLEHVSALFTGDLAPESIQDLRQAGGEVREQLDDHTNLLVMGECPNPTLVAAARERGSVLIWDMARFERLRGQLRKAGELTGSRLDRAQRSDLRLRSKALRAALKTRDPVTVDSAVDAFLDGAPGVLVDALVDGTSWAPGKALRAGRLVPNSFFSGSRPAGPTMERALRRIISGAPESAVQTRRLAGRVKSLQVEGESWLDLSTLSGFTALEWLQISPRPRRTRADHARIHTTGTKVLATLTKLRRLEIEHLNIIQLGDLPLDGLCSLQSLKIVGCPLQNLHGASWLAGLESLHIGIREGNGWTKLETVPLFEVEELSRMPALRQLSLHRVQIDRLPSLPGLEELELGLLPDLKQLKLSSMPSLERVHIRSRILQSLHLSELPALVSLRVEAGGLKRLSCHALPALRFLRAGDFGLHPRPVLQSLTLEETEAVEELELSGLGMEKLDLPMLPRLGRVQLQAPIQSRKPGPHLRLQSCEGLAEVEIQGRFKSLDLGASLKLKRLSIQGTLAHDLCLHGLPELEQLLVRGGRDAGGPRKVQLGDLPHLKELQIGGGGPESVQLGQLPALERMVLGGPGQPATRLTTVEMESRLSQLRFLLICAPAFEGPEGRTQLPRLQTLDLSGSRTLRTLDWVAALTRLQALHARDCELLEDARGVVGLPELVHLDLRACDLLRPVPKPPLMQNRDEVVEYKKKLARAKSRSRSARRRPSNHALQAGLRRVLRARNAEGTIDAISALRRARSVEALDGLLDGLGLDRLASSLDLFASDVIEDGADQPLAQAALWQSEESAASGEPRRLRLVSPNRTFEGKAEGQALRSWAMVKLLAMVPRSCEQAHRLRESINGIHLSQCPDGVLPRLASFTQLRTLSVGPVRGEERPPDQIKDLDPLSSLGGLRDLRIQREYALQSLQGMESLELEHLAIVDCPSLEDLRGLAWQTRLRVLVLEAAAEEGRFFEHLVDLTPLRGLKALERLSLHGLSGLPDIKALADLRCLRQLQVHGAIQLESLEPLAGLENLQAASLCGLHKVRDLRGLSELDQLKNLRLAHCQGLETSRGLAGLPALESLDLRGCTALRTLEMKSMPELRELDLSGCHSLEEVSALAAAPRLERLFLSSRRETCLDGISSCSELQQLDLSGEGVDDLDFLEDLEHLHTLSLHLASAADLQPLLRAPGLQKVYVSEALHEPARAVLGKRPEVVLLSSRTES